MGSQENSMTHEKETLEWGNERHGSFQNYTEDDLEQLHRQEPLPPNQSPMLPADEQPQPTETNYL